MTTGGSIIEVREMTVRTGHPSAPVRVNRLWCVAPNMDEVCVFAAWYPPGQGPLLGEAVWWQSGWIYYDQDRKQIKKVAYTYRPKGADA